MSITLRSPRLNGWWAAEQTYCQIYCQKREGEGIPGDRAAARGMPPATYVSVFTRAHLRSLAPLPAEELLALKRTLGELGSIGRNLNQIAHAANLGQVVTGPGRNDLEAMLRVCKTLRDSLKGVLLANLKSWEQGAP